jgi:hypothetical protein
MFLNEFLIFKTLIMRNPNKLFSPNGQLRIDDTDAHEGDWHTITISSDAVFTQLLNDSVDILSRDKLAGKTIKSSDQPLTGKFTLIQLESGVIFANRN